MFKLSLLILVLLSSINVISQNLVEGNIIDKQTHLPIEGATITLLPGKVSSVTDQNGRFFFHGNFDNTTTFIVNSIGYATQTFTFQYLKTNRFLSISPKQIMLEDVVVVANAGNQYKPISKTDIAMRGVNNSQEVLRIIQV